MLVRLHPSQKKLLLTLGEYTLILSLFGDGSAGIIFKAPVSDITAWEQAIVSRRWEMGFYPTGAVLRLYLTIMRSLPDERLPLPFRAQTRDLKGRKWIEAVTVDFEGETMLNPTDVEERKIIKALTQQDTIAIHFFDTSAEYVCSKFYPHADVTSQIADMLLRADQYLATIPAGELDFFKAAEAMRRDRPMDYSLKSR